MVQGRPQLPTVLLAKELVHALQVVAPTSYELLPAGDAAWGSRAPSLAYRNATTGDWVNVTMGSGWADVAGAALARNGVFAPSLGRWVPLPFGWAQLREAERTVRRHAQRPLEGPPFPFAYHGLIGTGTPTAFDMVFTEPIADATLLAKDGTPYALVASSDGDGVVPTQVSDSSTPVRRQLTPVRWGTERASGWIQRKRPHRMGDGWDSTF